MGNKFVLLRSVLVFVLIAGLGAALLVAESAKYVEGRRQLAIQVAEGEVSLLSQRLNAAISLAYTLEALLREKNFDVNQEILNRFSEHLLKTHPPISSLQYAPKGIVTYIAPLQGNEPAIGHNLLQDPKRNKEAFDAVEKHVLTVAGPFKLLQGGVALVARLPIFEDSAHVFWGFSTVVVKIDDLMKSTSIENLTSQSYLWNIYRIHPDTQQPHIFYGNADTLIPGAVTLTIQAPNATWFLNLKPVDGWLAGHGTFILLGMLLCLAFAGSGAYLSYILLMQPYELKSQVLLRTTELNTTKDILAKSEERLMQIAENEQMWIWEVDADGLYVYCSRACETILGYEVAEILGRKYFYDFFHPDDKEALKAAAFETFKSKQHFSDFINRNMTKTGGVVWLSTSGVPILDGNGGLLGYRGADIDITKRKHAVEAQRESEERWKAIIESEPECVKLLDHEGKVVFMNPAGLEMIQASLEEVRGKRASGLVMQDDREAFEEMVNGVFRGEKRHLVFDMLGLQGRRLTLESVSVPLWDSAEKQRVKWLVGITRDITERTRLMDEYRRSTQLAALGTVAAGVAHEINNPIQGIINYATIIGNAPDKTDRIVDISSRIVKEGERIAGITRNLLHYAKDNRGEFRVTDILEPIKEATSLVNLNYKRSGVTIVTDFPGSPVLVMANPQWIQQVVVNLVENSFDAVLAKGTVREGEEIRVNGSIVDDGNHAQFRLEVVDFGIGIPQANLGRVRDAFFTTKQETKGTGLGLSIVSDIVAKHHGTLEIESEEGRYTRATVALPVSSRN